MPSYLPTTLTTPISRTGAPPLTACRPAAALRPRAPLASSPPRLRSARCPSTCPSPAARTRARSSRSCTRGTRCMSTPELPPSKTRTVVRRSCTKQGWRAELKSGEILATDDSTFCQAGAHRQWCCMWCCRTRRHQRDRGAARVCTCSLHARVKAECSRRRALRVWRLPQHAS
jgi:hypothetical protein